MSIVVIKNIADIDILYCSALWPTHKYFIIASKVGNDVSVVPESKVHGFI